VLTDDTDPGVPGLLMHKTTQDVLFSLALCVNFAGKTVDSVIHLWPIIVIDALQILVLWYLLCFMSLYVFFICFYLIVCCFSVIWALLPEINVMMMMLMTMMILWLIDWLIGSRIVLHSCPAHFLWQRQQTAWNFPVFMRCD